MRKHVKFVLRVVNWIIIVSFTLDVLYITLFPLYIYRGDGGINLLTFFVWWFYIGPVTMAYFVFLVLCCFNPAGRQALARDGKSFVSVPIVLFASNYNLLFYVLVG